MEKPMFDCLQQKIGQVDRNHKKTVEKMVFISHVLLIHC
jgi:hypothetical protein